MLSRLAFASGLIVLSIGCASTPTGSPPTTTPMSMVQSPTSPANQPNDTPLEERLPAPAEGPPESASVTVTADSLTLAAIEELACKYNPTLVQARAQVDGTLGKALQAGLWPNPVLGYSAELIGADGTPGEFQGGFVQQEIITARKRRVSRQKYLARAEAAEFVALAQQYRVLNDIRRMYWRAAGAGRMVMIREQMVKNAEDRLLTTDEMFNVGQATGVEVRQARIGLRRAKLEYLAAINDRDRHLRELAALVGTHLPAYPLADTLDATVPPLTWDASLAYTIAESPEVLEAHAKLRSDRFTVDRERRQPIPNVVVQGGPGYDFTEDKTVVNAQVSMRIPIWNRNQGTIRQAQADLMRQEAEVRRIELVLGRELADRFRDYQTAQQHVDSYRAEILPEAEQAYRDRLNAYKERRQTWPMVLDAQAELYDRQAEFVRNLVAWRESQTLIEGFLLTGGLDAPPNPTPPGHIDATPQPR